MISIDGGINIRASLFDFGNNGCSDHGTGPPKLWGFGLLQLCSEGSIIFLSDSANLGSNWRIHRTNRGFEQQKCEDLSNNKSMNLCEKYCSFSKQLKSWVVGTRLIDGRGVLVIFRSFCRGFYSIFCRCRPASGRFFNLVFLLFRCFFSFLWTFLLELHTLLMLRCELSF